ncbi:MAG TPA: winged helix-turn-helix domain-containing protein [Vicinamibacterales bacterium]|nr:winged helix-turn-helix domain-containing protein [Vicinamibacterales bacterium]
METTEAQTYRFGVFEFDPGTLQLRRNGRPVRIRPQSLRLLGLLIARHGELVTRDEIQRTLWGENTFVDFEQGINHSIKQLRTVLRDHAESPRFIETLPRRGYRFIAPVDVTRARGSVPLGSPSHPAAVGGEPAARGESRDGFGNGSRRRPGMYAAAAAALAAALAVVAGLQMRGRELRPGEPRQRTLAVLPFATSGFDPILGTGLADAISARLAGQRAIPVRPATVVRHSLQGRPAPPLEAGRALGADLVLDGQVVTTRDHISVLTQLTDVAAQAVIWSSRLRVRPDQLFSVEDVVAERVVAALRLQLAAAEQERLRRRYTSHREAYEAYLRGRAALVEYTPEGTRRAIAAFERALEHDGAYALARAGLAMASADMFLRFAPPADVERWGNRAETEARSALALDPDLAEAHLARAAVARKREFDWGLTIDSSRRALVLNPNLDQAHFFIAAAFYHLGYMEEALIELERGRRLRGIDVVEPLRIEALVAFFSGKLTSARVLLEEVGRRSDAAIGDTYLGLAHYYTGNVDRGRLVLQSVAQTASASAASRATAALAGVLAAQGEHSHARALLRAVLSREYRDHHVAYSVGSAYAQLGETGEALRWLRTAAATGFPCLPWFERDPLLDPIRRDPRFADLLERVKADRDLARSGVATASGEASNFAAERAPAFLRRP